MELAPLASALVVLVLTPRVMSWARSRGILGPDVRKPGRPMKPEMGGLAIVAGLLTGILVAEAEGVMGGLGYPIAATILGAALVGTLDDLKGIRRRWKPVLVAMAAAPAAVAGIGDPHFSLGPIELTVPGALYWALLVPLGVTGAANAINMLAGYNGLEAGEVAVASLFLALISPPGPGRTLSLILLASCLAFLVYNWYPGRTFIGDVGTLTLGSAFALASIIADRELYGIILIAPTFYELASVIRYTLLRGIIAKEAAESPVIEDGKLRPPEGWETLTLPYLLLSLRPAREWEVVLEVLALFALCGIVVLILCE